MAAAKRKSCDSSAITPSSVLPKHDAKWHAMMARKRQYLSAAKKPKTKNTGDSVITTEINPWLEDVYGIETSHGETWIRGPLLGEGGFGSVFLAKSKPSVDLNNKEADDYGLANSPKLMAVKSSEHARGATSLKHEREIMQKLNQSYYVIQCYGEEITKSKNGRKTFYNILLEYCSGGTLYDRIGKSLLSGYEIRSYTRDILKGLVYIHEQGYAHCDIKPDNLLLQQLPCCEPDRYTVRIADFGLAKKAYFGHDYEKDGYQFMVQGTYRYLSPEAVGMHVQETPADVWALGCVVVEMVTREPVWGYHGGDKRALFVRIANGDQVPEIPDNVSVDCRDFFNKCFAKDPDQRWPAETLALHPFVSLHNSHHFILQETT